MDNKIGDLLLCKKDLRRGEACADGEHWEIILEKGKFYKVKDIQTYNSQSKLYEKRCTIFFHGVTVCLWYKHESLSFLDYYVWSYFYTTAELREIQIDSILNDD